MPNNILDIDPKGVRENPTERYDVRDAKNLIAGIDAIGKTKQYQDKAMGQAQDISDSVRAAFPVGSKAFPDQ